MWILSHISAKFFYINIILGNLLETLEIEKKMLLREKLLILSLLSALVDLDA